ncbi:MAG: hypothetical protein P1U88_23240 [Thalassobaculaceae bacterium]|nr:hypothetical protein [Thalassobaculaceae bacterium]
MKLHAGEEHARQRLAARYGLKLTVGLKAEIVREIKYSNKARKRKSPDRKMERRKRDRPRECRAWFLSGANQRAQKWRVNTSEGELILIYDQISTLIVTFLDNKPEVGR